MEKKKTKSTTKSTRVSKTKKVEEKNIKEQEEKLFSSKNDNSGFYYSFGKRLVTNVVLLLVLSILLAFSCIKSFAITKKEFINYREKSNIDYRVYLKDNSFYDEEYLGKNMAYVASLIDKISIDYNYYFDVDKLSNLDIKYKIKAKLIIASQQNSNVFFVKEYDLSKQVMDEMINDNKYSIVKRDVVIDYGYYNDLANDFKSRYAINTDSKLEVSLEIVENNREDNSYDFSNNSRVSLIIPLSQQEVNISLDDKEINSEKQIINNPRFVVKNIEFSIISVILLIFTIIALVSLIKKILLISGNKSNKYDRYVNRLLRGYDRIIINLKTIPDLDEYKIIKVESFQELIDIRDNVSEPINYYVITPHQKCEFFVINKNNIYLYTVKNADLDGENGKEGKK